MTQDSKLALKIAAKLVLSWMVLSAVGAIFGQQLINHLLPLLQNFAQSITDDFYVNLMWQSDNARMLMIEANFGIPKTNIEALGIGPGAKVSAGTNVEHVLVPLILLFSVLICWPVYKWQHRGILLLLGIPATAVTLLLTTPFLLVGKVESLLQEQAASLQIVRDKPWYLHWMLFTEVGGRWLLPITCGLLCVWLLYWLFIGKKSVVVTNSL